MLSECLVYDQVDASVILMRQLSKLIIDPTIKPHGPGNCFRPCPIGPFLEA